MSWRYVRRFAAAAALAAVMLTVPTKVWAQDEENAVEFKKRTVIDLTDAVIEGQLVQPDGSYIVNRKLSRFTSMIQIRMHFVPELLESHVDL